MRFKFGDLKIRIKILLGFLLVILFIGFLGGMSYRSLSDVVDNKIPLIVKNEGIVKCMLEMRKNEKDFLLIEQSNIDFYKSGESDYVNKFELNYNEILKEINYIKNDKVVRSQTECVKKLDDMKNLTQEYHNIFFDVVNKTRIKGFKDYGLVGELREAVHNIENSLVNLPNGEQLQISMLNMRRDEKDYFLRKDLKYVNQLSEGVSDFKKKLDILDFDQSVKDNLYKLIDEYEDKFNNVVSIDKEIGLKNTEGLTGKYRNTIHKLEPLNKEVYENIEKSLYDYLNNISKQTMILIIIIILAAVALAILIANLITKPIKGMVKVAQTIASGDLTKEIKITSKDETGELTLALKDMQEHLKNLINKVKNTVEDVTCSSNHLSVASEENAKISEELASVVDNVAAGAEKQSLHIQETKASIMRLMDVVEDAKSSSEKMSQLSNDISEKANMGKNVLHKAVNQMEMISTTTNHTNSDIKKLNEMSQKIGQILEVISSISEQTNLLALNAAIEAASAGERGKGFTVVAEEIRKLAEQSQLATKEIAELINAMQNETKLVVNSMETTNKEVVSGQVVIKETGDIFNKILETIQNTTNLIEQVSGGMKQIQQNGDSAEDSIKYAAEMIDNFTSSAEEMNASAEEQAATAEENSATAEELKELAEKLRILIEEFKV